MRKRHEWATIIGALGISAGMAHNSAVASDDVLRMTNPSTVPRDHVASVLDYASMRLENCDLHATNVTSADATGWFYYDVRAEIIGGAVDGPLHFRSRLDLDVKSDAEAILRSIPGVMFRYCRPVTPGFVRLPRPYQPGTWGDPRSQVDQILFGLNQRLEGCTVRLVDSVGAADPQGTFRFYLDALYSDGRVDERINFETSVNNTVESEIADFLKLIPSVAFPGCRHRQGPTPPVPPPPGPVLPPTNPPVPPPINPSNGLARQHISSVLLHVNQALQGCTLGISGGIEHVNNHGDFTYFLEAVYDDGTFADPVRFQSNVYFLTELEVQSLLRMIPAFEFTRCRSSRPFEE